jgi:hypothetical protein
MPLRHHNVIEPPCMISLLSFSPSSPRARQSIDAVFSPFHFQLGRISINNKYMESQTTQMILFTSWFLGDGRGGTSWNEKVAKGKLSHDEYIRMTDCQILSQYCLICWSDGPTQTPTVPPSFSLNPPNVVLMQRSHVPTQPMKRVGI